MTAGFLTVPFSGNSLLPDSFLSFFLFLSIPVHIHGA